MKYFTYPLSGMRKEAGDWKYEAISPRLQKELDMRSKELLDTLKKKFNVPPAEPGYAQRLTTFRDGEAPLPRFGSPDFYRAYFPKPINTVNSVLRHPFVRKLNEGAINVRDWARDNGYLK